MPVNYRDVLVGFVYHMIPDAVNVFVDMFFSNSDVLNEKSMETYFRSISIISLLFSMNLLMEENNMIKHIMQKCIS